MKERMRRRLLLLLCCVLTSVLFSQGWAGSASSDSDMAPSEQQRFWQDLNKPGHFVIMRHALAPGTGDPPDFELGNCDTQRNLDNAGRQQAKEIGNRLVSGGLATAAVYSSAWCRCLETARLLDVGEVTVMPALNSFFRSRDREPAQTAALKEWLSQTLPIASGALVLVTHQVNITALTGVFPASGEMILARLEQAGMVEVVARMAVTPQ